MSIPAAFAKNMQLILTNPSEYAEFMASLEQPRQRGLRINTLKITPEAFAELFGSLKTVDWCSTGRYYNNQDTAPLGKNPLYNAGLYYIQEPSAMSAAAILNPQPRDKVLDLCASPGGKSTQMAALLGGHGLLVSNDANFSRIPQLVRNVEMAGITNSIILCETPERMSRRFTSYFDRVLVDAPCSGEGMFRKDPSTRLAWDAAKPARLAVIQKNILFHAAKMVTDGGYLAYSTCTFNTTENEDVAADFLAQNGDFQLISQTRIWPHIHKGEGHFVALFRKTTPKAGGSQYSAGIRPIKIDKDFQTFMDTYQIKLPSGCIQVHSDKLFVPPQIYPDLSGLRVIRAGLLLGTLKKHRFEPSYALAMALQQSGFANVINLPNHHTNITKFLGGETFEIDAKDGYNLFCVEGYPMGFAKILKNRLKGRII